MKDTKIRFIQSRRGAESIFDTFLGLDFHFKKRLIAEVWILIKPKKEKGFKKATPYYALSCACLFNSETGKVGLPFSWYKGKYYSPFYWYENEIRNAWLQRQKEVENE